MTPDVHDVLGELDGHPVRQLTLRASGFEYRQLLGWYWEVQRDGLVVQRGFHVEPRTEIEIEDLLRQIERNTHNVKDT